MTLKTRTNSLTINMEANGTGLKAQALSKPCWTLGKGLVKFFLQSHCLALAARLDNGVGGHLLHLQQPACCLPHSSTIISISPFVPKKRIYLLGGK